MNKKIQAFTLSEILVVISIIGVLTVLTLSTMGNKVDRHKALFKKAYSLIERTVVELVNDETYYPYDYNNFGFKETSDVKILGADGEKTFDNITFSTDASTKKTEQKIAKFCKLFSNNLNLNGELEYLDSSSEATKKSPKSCRFTTNDNISWSINTASKRDTENFSGFMVTIDANGSKEPNKPETVGNVPDTKQGKTKNRDRFYVYVRDDGKMFLPNSDKTARMYLRSKNLNAQEEEE